MSSVSQSRCKSYGSFARWKTLDPQARFFAQLNNGKGRESERERAKLQDREVFSRIFNVFSNFRGRKCVLKISDWYISNVHHFVSKIPMLHVEVSAWLTRTWGVVGVIKRGRSLAPVPIVSVFPSSYAFIKGKSAMVSLQRGSSSISLSLSCLAPAVSSTSVCVALSLRRASFSLFHPYRGLRKLRLPLLIAVRRCLEWVRWRSYRPSTCPRCAQIGKASPRLSPSSTTHPFRPLSTLSTSTSDDSVASLHDRDLLRRTADSPVAIVFLGVDSFRNAGEAIVAPGVRCSIWIFFDWNSALVRFWIMLHHFILFPILQVNARFYHIFCPK